jgi:hypothetical protein
MQTDFLKVEKAAKVRNQESQRLNLKVPLMQEFKRRKNLMLETA